MNQNLSTIEGCNYKITLNFTGQEDLADYEIYGAACRLGCSRHHSDFKITEKTNNTCTLIIPPLNTGTHLYQIFIKRRSTNQEFLVLDGRIEVSNRCGDVEHQSINSTAAELDVVFNADEVTVNVTINEGSKGERGERGERGEQGEKGQDGQKGEKGDPFTYDDFTAEQLESLKGERGEKGDKGDPGESTSLDWAAAQPLNETRVYAAEAGTNSIAIGYDSKAASGANISIGNFTGRNSANNTEFCVLIGGGAYSNGSEATAVGVNNTTAYRGTAVGSSAHSNGDYGVTVGSYSDSNFQSVSIGSGTYTGLGAIAIGLEANADDYGVAIGLGATARTGMVALLANNEGIYKTDFNIIAPHVFSNTIDDKFGVGHDLYENGGLYIIAANRTRYAFSFDELQKAINNNSSNDSGNDSNNNSSTSTLDMGLVYEYMGKYARFEDSSQIYEAYPQEEDPTTGVWVYRYMRDINEQGEWCYSLEKLTDGYYLFYDKTDNQNLKKFASRLDYLTTAERMFAGCINLSDFSPTLPALQYAYLMFGEGTWDCTRLNVQSIERIADSLPWGNNQDIYIGIAKELQNDYGDGKYQRCQAALEKIRNKDWIVYEIYSAIDSEN